MTESILITGFLVALVFSSHCLSQWQGTAIELLGSSTHQAFLLTKHNALTVQEARAQSNINSALFETNSKKIELPTIYLKTLPEQLQMGYAQLSVKKSKSFRLIDSNSIAFARHTGELALNRRFYLKRQTHIDVGDGRSSSDRNVHDRIGQSKLLWFASASKTVPIAKSIALTTYPVDQAWGRAATDTKWLQKWNEVVPVQKISGSYP